ncbi:MAG: hypothetical protein ACRD2N_14030 [Vicinamibacterales bacterium]
MRSLDCAFFLAVFLFVSHLSGSVEAYLDPGTGSMAFQLVLGGIVGAIALIKLYWQRLRTFVLGRRETDH